MNSLSMSDRLTAHIIADSFQKADSCALCMNLCTSNFIESSSSSGSSGSLGWTESLTLQDIGLQLGAVFCSRSSSCVVVSLFVVRCRCVVNSVHYGR